VHNIHQARVLLHHIERRQKDVNFYGIVLSSFILCSVKTIYQGIVHLYNIRNPDFKLTSWQTEGEIPAAAGLCLPCPRLAEAMQLLLRQL